MLSNGKYIQVIMLADIACHMLRDTEIIYAQVIILLVTTTFALDAPQV
jgi:hypothetical protein